MPTTSLGWLRSRVASLLVSAVLGLAFSSAARAQNLLQNGSFESSSFNDSLATSEGIGYVSPPPGGGSGPRATVPNWTWTADPAAPAYTSTFALNITGGNLGETAEDGSYAVSFGTGSYSGGGTITQSFTPTSGSLYLGSLYVRRIGAGEPIGAQVTITNNVDGSTVTTVPIDMSAMVANQWNLVTFSFTAPSSSLSFSFKDTTQPGTAGSTDLGLDNVSIVAAQTQTLTILGGSGNLGDIAANTECSTDNGATWHPAYLAGQHPWGNIPGTNIWINQAPNLTTGLYQTTLFRVRFNAPAVMASPSMTFTVNADNIGVMSINGHSLSTTYGGYPPYDTRTLGAQYIVPGQNTINVALTDQGGLVGINYRVDLTAIAAQPITVVQLPPVITSTLTASGTVGTSFSYAIKAGNTPTSFGAANLPPGLSVNATTGVISGTPTTIGTYNSTISAANSAGTTTATLVITINKGAATVTLGSLNQVYDGTVKSATATTNPANLAVAFSYSGPSLPPINAGTYGVLAAVNDSNYSGSASGNLTISAAPFSITLGNLTQSYDGTPKSVSVTTSPSGIATNVTYNGSTTAPSAVGSYAVAATSANPNYAGTASGTLTIQDTTPPVLSLPGNITLEATGATGAIATFSASANDVVSGAVAVTATPASGSLFPLGTTTVTAKATDAAGNTATGNFTVTVRDTTPPVITVTSGSDFSENFNDYTNGTAYYPQYQSGLQQEYQGTLPNWSNTGFHAVHAVNLDGNGNWAVMIWQDNVITSTKTTSDNATGADYVVRFNAGPAVSADPSQATTATDGLVIQVLRADNSVLSSFNYQPGAWAGAPALVPVSFHYTGDGSGPLHVSVGPLVPNDGHFGGAIDDLSITPATPANITLEATSSAGAVATWGATAFDIVSGSVPVVASPVSGSTFPLGTTTVALTATDAAGNTASSSFHVVVQDTTAPALTVPSDITAEATGPDGAAVTFSASATDAVTASPAISYSQNPGTTFPIGTTTVAVTAVDAAGNKSTGSFKVTVHDTTPPKIATPANVVAEATSATGAVVTFNATATDLVSGNVTVTASPASGSTFALGTTTVTLTATDATGNTATSSFTVTVRDTTPPALKLPSNLVLEATSPVGAAATYVATATDAVTASPTIAYSIASGTTFALGTTTVNVTATDAAGNKSTGSFTVTVRDTTPPALTVPANQVLEATSASGATATFSASATDIVTVSPAIAYSQASGTTFPLGTTTVSVTATDAAGNASTGSFTITVRDTTPPTLTVPANMVLEATSAAGAVANFAATATDIVTASPAIAYSQNPGTTFPIGTTTVSVTATDAAGNQSTGSFTVTVRDTTPPTIASLTASPNTIWPPNKKMVAVTITANTTDIVGVASVKIVSVATNEPDGSTQWQITGPLTLDLKADRLGTGTGRIYTITVEARDAAGNASTKTVTVTVPHDQGK